MLTIKFGLWIQDHDIDDFYKLNGPVFSRWLPNGEDDALKVVIDNYSSEVHLWFERHGYIDDSGFIKYEHKRLEIDSSVIPRQEKIHAGALYGKVIYNDISEEQIQALKDGDVENDEYIKIGKLIIKKILGPVLVKFTKLLKNTYGQYWINIYKPFDSRHIALSNHCKSLNMKWFLNDSDNGEFSPGKEEVQTISFTVTMNAEEEYISQDSWLHLQELLNDNFDPTLSSAFASRANKLLEEQRYSHAILESVTAIELSIEEYIRRSISNAPDLEDHMRSFWNNPLPTRISLVASLAGADTNDILLSISGVNERNNFVHDGKETDSSASELIKGLLRTTSHLNNEQNLKFPVANISNSLSPEE